MRFLVHREQLRRVDVRVALGRAQTRVAEQLLNGAQIGAALQQMGRKGMSQRVRTDAAGRWQMRRIARTSRSMSGRSAAAAVVHEQRIAAAAAGGWTGGPAARLRRPRGARVHHRAVSRSFR